MADGSDSSDKTEDPTQKRLDDAHERGDVAKSQEINTWFVIAGGTLVLQTFSGSIGGGILMPLRNLIAKSWMIHTDGASLLVLTQSLGYALMAALGVPFLLLALTAVLWPERHRLESFMHFDPGMILSATTSLTVHLMGAVVAMLAAVAIADYLFQYRP